jgi:hypothetical protein
MRLEPFSHGQHNLEEHLVHFYTGLDFKVASLTKRGKVPVGTVAFVSVQVVRGEHVPGFNFVLVPAPLAFPACRSFYPVRDRRPISRILVSMFHIPILT